MTKHLRSNVNAVITGRVKEAGLGVLMVVDFPEPTVYNRPRLKFDTLSGGNMGTSLAVIQRVGFLDEDPSVSTAEDTEWAYRVLRCGVPIIYSPDVTVWHYGWRDENQRIAQYKAYARSHGGFFGKYLRTGDWFIALRVVIHFLRALRRWLFGVLTGQRELVLNGQAYLTGLLPGIIDGFRRNRSP
jgi:GT2 family glycosyltransferase